MKRFTFYLLSSITLFACTEGADDIVPEIKLETSSVDFTDEGGSYTINFTSADTWTAEVINNNTDAWCSVSPTSGSAGNVKIIITAIANDTTDDRTASVFIKSGTISQKISVTQGASTNKIPDNQIWYTNGSTTEATTPAAPDAFGANIVSNKFDIDKGYWVITFDDSVTKIGDNAFGCCESLTSVIIGNCVTSIGVVAFFGCTNLTNITIPDSVTSIGYSAFECCYSLTSFYGKFASSDNRCLIIDGKLNSFAPAGLTEYTIPVSVTEIGEYAFSSCDSLTNVTIPDSVTSIGYGAFQDCSNLTSFTVPDSITKIGTSVFVGCRRLLSFYGKFASSDNRCLIIDGVLKSFAPALLTRYTIPDSVTKIGAYAFSGCDMLSGVTIPNSVTKINFGAFWGCNNLNSITIPDSVTEIGNYAFVDCRSLTSVTIPNYVTEIGEASFLACISLTSVTIPDSVASIGEMAFRDCESLISVYCKPTIPPIGGGSMFDNNASNRRIYVLTTSVDAYKSANYWNDYTSAIVGYF